MDQNKKNISLTFADIVGEAVVFGPGRIDNVEIFGNGRNKNEEDCLEEIVEKAKQIKIEGLKVTVKASEVMRIIQEVKDQIYETTPEGWKTVGALERELNAGSFIIRNMIFPYRSIRPEWFKVFLDKSLGRAFEHFHPNLVKTIKRSLEERRAVGLAPDGWKTKSALGRSLHIDVRALEEVLTENKIKNPNYFKIFTNKMGRLFEYLHPDLVKIIKEEYRERLEINHAPAGWMVANSLLDDLQIGYIVFGKIVAPYRTTNSEWFKLFLDDRNWPQEFMHPELVKIVKGELAERQKNGHAPEGWMVANMLKAKLNTDTPAIIRSRLKKYRKNNPDQFRTFLNGQNRQAEYISPYLVSMISQEINCSREQIVNIEVPPDGWVTSSYLRKKENIGGKKIRDIANKFRNTNPELLGIYLEPKNNKPIEYFSPELVEAMRQPLKRKPKK